MTGFGENVLVTGANRGIGLSLVEHLVKNQEIKKIFAACRDPSTAEDLKVLWNLYNEKIYIIQLDVQDDTSISLAYEKIERILNREPLNLLINNAGIAEKKNSSLKDASREVFTRQFDVNITGTIMVTSKFMPLILKASENDKRSLVVNISSTLGSLGVNYLSDARTIAYSISKAGLNHFMRQTSKILEEQGANVIMVSICPGSVQTDMTGPKALRPTSEAIPPLLETISKLTKNDNGRFMNRLGEDIPF